MTAYLVAFYATVALFTFTLAADIVLDPPCTDRGVPQWLVSCWYVTALLDGITFMLRPDGLHIAPMFLGIVGVLALLSILRRPVRNPRRTQSEQR